MWWKRLCLDGGWSVLQSSVYAGPPSIPLRVFAQMPLRRSLLLLLAWLVFVPAVSAQGWSDDPEIEARVEAVLQQMTLEEKLGQLSQYSGGMPTGPAAAAAATRR